MKYFEGYYCKDDNSVNGIKTDSSRQVLHTIGSHYPSGITVKEISNQTKIPSDTVRGSLKSLEDTGFITRTRYEKSRGRPGKSDDDDRSYRYHIENRNFALNKEGKFQFAPGYTKYTSEFLCAWNVLVEKKKLDEVYSILMKILRQAMTKIISSDDPILKKLAPNIEISTGKDDRINMQCQFCKVNHDARDFIRATLLHILDQFETSSAFIDFAKDQQFISKDIANYRAVQEKSKVEEQAKEWLDNLAPDANSIAKSILKKSPFSIEQLMSRVNKLTERHFEERLGKYTQMDEQNALSIIANELRLNLDYASKSHYQLQSIPPEISVIKIEQSQTKDGIKVTLHRVEFTAECSAVFLTVENTSDNHCTVEFDDKNVIAIQGNYEFKVTSIGPNYRSFRKRFKYGDKEYGAVKFERLHYNEPSVRFEFPLIEKAADKFFGGAAVWSFVFEVQIQK
jgi:DNA-binding transcriptional ArsR family regulator